MTGMFPRAAPNRPKIYHITHINNLAPIAEEGCLVCDRTMAERGGPTQAIGMRRLKDSRITQRGVLCHPGTMVGDYVPFYFCPRSVMLYVIYRGNHRELAYRGGQEPIAHLEADLAAVVSWTECEGRRWAISLCNAAAGYAEFRSSLDALGELDWRAIGARDFRDQDVKEAKQAEFLVFGMFPFSLVERVGVISPVMQDRATAALAATAHHPLVQVRSEWYY